MENAVWVVVTEVLMTAFIIWIISYLRMQRANSSLRAYSLSIFLLSMMGSMFDALAYYMLTPSSFLSSILAVNIAMIIMTLAILYIMFAAMQERDSSYTAAKVLAFSLLLVWNEASMAVFLRVLAFGLPGSPGIEGFLAYLGLSITSILFLIPMLVEMLYFIGFQMRTGMEKKVAAAILIMQVADPALFGDSSIVFPMLVVYSILMIFAVYYVFSALYRKRDSITSGDSRMAFWFLILILISAAGLIIPVFIPKPFGLSWLVFAISMVVAMFLYFTVILHYFSIRYAEKPSGLTAAS